MEAAAMQEFTVEYEGKSVFGKIAFPEGPGPWPIVIFSHGFGASRVYDSGMHRDFIERGMAYAAFDFCCGMPGSQSSGTTKEMSVLTEARDLEKVLDWICGLEQVDDSRVFLLGTSQGGFVSTYVASGRPDDIAGLVLFFPAFNICDDAHARVAACGGVIPDEMQVGPHTIGRCYNEDAMSFDIFDYIGKYPGDVLIVHGAQDKIVPIKYSYRAAETFPGSCELEVIEELGHGFRSAPPEIHAKAIGLAIEFFSRHL